MACGFFIVLILERLVLSCNKRGNMETAPLLPSEGHSHSHTHRSINEVESSSHHVHMDLQAHSSFRSFMLFLSLSLHSVFEGLAIGLQATDTKVKALLLSADFYIAGVKHESRTARDVHNERVLQLCISNTFLYVE